MKLSSSWNLGLSNFPAVQPETLLVSLTARNSTFRCLPSGFVHFFPHLFCFQSKMTCVTNGDFIFTCDLVAFSSLTRIFGRRLDHSFPTCAFFFNVEISSRTLIPLFRPGLVHSVSAN